MTYDNTKPALQAMEQSNGNFYIYRNGLHIATINANPSFGYKMYYRGTGHGNGRKHHPTPETCVQAFFGRKAIFNRIGDA